MHWWEWFMPWKWPFFGRRKEEEVSTSDRFRTALKEAREHRGNLDNAVADLKKQREERQAESLAQPLARVADR